MKVQQSDFPPDCGYAEPDPQTPDVLVLAPTLIADQPTRDAAAVRKGDRVLCLNPTGSLRPTIGALMGAFGPLSRSAAGAEALVLRNRGATATIINPDHASAAAMGTNLMDAEVRQAVIDAGLAQGRRLAAQRQARAA